MGSSFSDLDGMCFFLVIPCSNPFLLWWGVLFTNHRSRADTSITQSALEEALASNLRHGGASRLSNLSHAFRSRYMQ
jgi:hypothetical protein